MNLRRRWIEATALLLTAAFVTVHVAAAMPTVPVALGLGVLNAGAVILASRRLPLTLP